MTTTPPEKPRDADRAPQRVCVFCGSALGADPAFGQAAAAMGGAIAARGLGLVYGGASIGLMAAAADAALAAGGEAIGVIPAMLLEREVGHQGLTELHVTHSMHERKALMAELSGAFIALPGGIGTFEELFEVWTWSQLGAHRKPVGLLNVGGFYDPLLEFLDRVTAQGFLKPAHRALLMVEREPEALLSRLIAAPPAETEDWLDLGQI